MLTAGIARDIRVPHISSRSPYSSSSGVPIAPFSNPAPFFRTSQKKLLFFSVHELNTGVMEYHFRDCSSSSQRVISDAERSGIDTRGSAGFPNVSFPGCIDNTMDPRMGFQSVVTLIGFRRDKCDVIP
nr:hypothetical protein [Escherichia coli]